MSARADEAYGQNGVSWVDRLGVWLSQRALRTHFSRNAELEVLELGCGYHARLLVSLRERMRRGVGVDFQINPTLRNCAPLSFHEGPIEETLPKLADTSFDVVMLISVLEHLAMPLAALESAWRLLKPGGCLLVNVPTWRGKACLEFSAFRLGLSPKVEMDDHKMYYDKRDLWPLLVSAGFKPSRIALSYHKFGLNLFAAAHREP